MRFFRLHTIRITVALILSIGLVPFLSPWQTVDAENKEFAKWLTKLAKDEAKDQVHDKVRELGNSQDVLKDASRLVKNNSDWFSLPLDDESNSSDEEVYELIKKEWRTYQHGSSMGGEMAVERQQRPAWTPEKQLFSVYAAISNTAPVTFPPDTGPNPTSYTIAEEVPSALLSEISIRAP